MWWLWYQWIPAKMKVWYPWSLKELKSWVLFWSYQLNSNSAHLVHSGGKWTVLAVQCCFSGSSKTTPRILIFQLLLVMIINLRWIPLGPKPPLFWTYTFIPRHCVLVSLIFYISQKRGKGDSWEIFGRCLFLLTLLEENFPRPLQI